MTWSCWETIACIIVSVATWKQPEVGHVQGWIVDYGSEQSIQANAVYHGYDWTQYPGGCGVAAMSPTNLGQTVWIKLADGTWLACGVFDTVARTDWYHSVIQTAQASGEGEILEAPDWVMDRLGNHYGVRGEAYFGACPPWQGSEPQIYAPPVVVDPRRPPADDAGTTHGRYPPQLPVCDWMIHRR